MISKRLGPNTKNEFRAFSMLCVRVVFRGVTGVTGVRVVAHGMTGVRVMAHGMTGVRVVPRGMMLVRVVAYGVTKNSVILSIIDVNYCA